MLFRIAVLGLSLLASQVAPSPDATKPASEILPPVNDQQRFDPLPTMIKDGYQTVYGACVLFIPHLSPECSDNSNAESCAQDASDMNVRYAFYPNKRCSDLGGH